MSDTKTSDTNSDLPDQDALAAFATSALGSGRRRRRGAPGGTTPETTAPDATDGTPEPAEVPVTGTQEGTGEKDTPPAPDPEPAPEQSATEEPKAAVPAPAAPPEPTSAHPRTQPATPAEQPAERSTSAEVEMRAVSVPMTTTPIPPGLRGGTIEVQVPALGPAGARATQCTVMVSTGVRDRFAHYQMTKKMAGEKEPSNALVVRRAFLHAKRTNLFGKLLADVYHQQNAVDEEDYDEDGLLGDVIGRRTVRGRLKETGQQSFRPSEQELATYDAYCTAYGFPSRSDFLDCVLDEFLPQLPASGRRK